MKNVEINPFLAYTNCKIAIGLSFGTAEVMICDLCLVTNVITAKRNSIKLIYTSSHTLLILLSGGHS